MIRNVWMLTILISITNISATLRSENESSSIRGYRDRDGPVITDKDANWDRMDLVKVILG